MAMKYEELTRKIIGCAMRVHSALGNGFQEVIYQRSLEIEMGLEGLSFVREMEMPLFYREIQVGTRRLDPGIPFQHMSFPKFSLFSPHRPKKDICYYYPKIYWKNSNIRRSSNSS